MSEREPVGGGYVWKRCDACGAAVDWDQDICDTCVDELEDEYYED